LQLICDFDRTITTCTSRTSIGCMEDFEEFNGAFFIWAPAHAYCNANAHPEPCIAFCQWSFFERPRSCWTSIGRWSWMLG
jgi:hypothetical protein